MRVVSGILVLGLGLTIMLNSCQGNSYSENTQLPEEVTAEVDTNEIPLEKVAICVWNVAGLRQEPGNQDYTKDKKKNYLEAIIYGEKVEMLGEEVEIESESRTYMKVRLQDGQEGWVHDYLFEKNGTLAVVIKETELYRRPDFMTLRDDKFDPGEILVTMERQGEWLHVSGREKRKKGWIKVADNLSANTRDVKIALLYFKALQDKMADTRREKLEAILDEKSFSGSVLLDLVKEALKELDSASSGSGQRHIHSPENRMLLSDSQ